MKPGLKTAKAGSARKPRKPKSVSSKEAPKSIDPIPKRQVVGWREWVELPHLGGTKIKAKLDTGARSSALHAFNLQPFQERDRWFVQFDVHPLQRNDDVYKTFVAAVVDYRWITNSGGGREKRFVIVTTLKMGGDAWPIEVTLTDRDQMGFRMLVGRTAMHHRLIVDPAASYRVGKPGKTNGKVRTRPLPKPIHTATEEE